MPTRFALHVEKWKDCTLCHLSETRNRVVISRGKVPCDVLMCGEAPGSSEDVLGRPFVGPAGQLLDVIIKRAVAGLDWEPRFAFTNIVCCIPKDEDGSKNSEPEDESVLACQPRLAEFIELAKPRLVVCVGKLADDWVGSDYKLTLKLKEGIQRMMMKHPAYILRANVAHRGLLIQTAVVDLKTALVELGESSDV